MFHAIIGCGVITSNVPPLQVIGPHASLMASASTAVSFPLARLRLRSNGLPKVYFCRAHHSES